MSTCVICGQEFPARARKITCGLMTEQDNRIMNDLRYYAVYVATSGRQQLRWSKPLPSASAAQTQVKYEIGNGNATMGFVVRAEGMDREVLVSFTQPQAARKAVERYEKLLELTQGE